MAADPETLSIREIFGFYVREDGMVVLSLMLDGEETALTMKHDVAESIGMSFVNAAAKAKGVVEGREKVTPGGFVATQPPQKPEEPRPWGPRRPGKRDNKPN
jgi:hypothetical protein